MRSQAIERGAGTAKEIAHNAATRRGIGQHFSIRGHWLHGWMQFGLGRTRNVNMDVGNSSMAKASALDTEYAAINAELPAAILHFAQAGKIGFKNGTLLAVAVPAMGGAALPAVQDWFMLKVVIAPAKHSGLLAPDQACSQLELRGHESAAKHHAIASLGVRHRLRRQGAANHA